MFLTKKITKEIISLLSLHTKFCVWKILDLNKSHFVVCKS